MGSLAGREIRAAVVFKLRHVGDTLLSTPALRALSAAFPGIRVTAVVNEGTEETLSGNPDVDRILVFRRGRREAGGGARVREELSLLREIRSVRPELSVNLTEGDRGAILSRLSGARWRIGVAPARPGVLGKERLFTHLCPRPDRFRHAAMRDLDILAAAGIPPADLRLRFFVPEADRVSARAKLGAAGVGDGAPYAVVQPTSRWTFKCWTEKGMVEAVRHIAGKGIAPVLASGPDPAEVAMAGRIAGASGVAAPSLAGRLSLKELGAVLEGARLFFGVDSAPMHVAAAVGTPVVALFGPSGAFNWAPWEGRPWGHDADHRGGARFVGRHAVIQKDWECVPCGKDGCFGTKRSCCLEATTPAETAGAVDRVLSAAAER